MKPTKTIQKLLDQIEVKNNCPWDSDFIPDKEHIISKEELFSKKCIFCGEDVPVEWELDDCGGKITHLKPDKTTWLMNQNYYFYHQIAPDIHPKCKRLKEIFINWGISEKRAIESDSFEVCDENIDGYNAVVGWIKDPKRTGLYLFGPCGVGKTLLATKIILESSTESKLIISESDIYKRLTPRIGNFERQENIDEEVYWFKNVQLLVIDDLGIGMTSPWKTETLFDILSYRIDKGLSTFFTSNIVPNTLSKNLDKRNVSRISELSIPCYIGGKDHRIRE
jgi:DNA replication protein DnaC